LMASRKKFGPQRLMEAHYNEEIGEVELFQFVEVVEEMEDPYTQISLDEARQLDPDSEIGDSLGVKLDTSDFGRIAAQTAKQVIIQRVRDAERDNIYNDYKDRKGEIVTGNVQRLERGNLYISLGRAEAILQSREQVRGEVYRQGDRIRAYILDVQRSSKGPQIFLSRTHPRLLIKLFDMEVPEISEGIIKVVDAAREPGERAKISVYSTNRDVDPVGACVGMRGSRVQSVVQELRGEKIDIIPYSEDIAKYVSNALAPAKISRAYIDEENRNMEIVVEDEGPGIPSGNLSKVFDRFYTDRPGDDAFGKNSGLGLNISQQIVTAHGGDIWAENYNIQVRKGGRASRKRSGARFVIRLPAINTKRT